MDYDTYIENEVKLLDNLNMPYCLADNALTITITESYLNQTFYDDILSVGDRVTFRNGSDVEVDTGLSVKFINPRYFGLSHVNPNQVELQGRLASEMTG